ncbi:MAG TPA: A/G-specific adenine glycosylase [Opitutaceae bacterium]|nr:A/G-specific adenine glycosylase [Opitutaceae bacterium]
MAQALIARRTAFRRALRDWYRAHARRLPWREAPSLYGTVVSEFMLQQTQVRTVLPYFGRWLAALPDFAALAAAPEAQVLKLWEGLGYYSRARNLHRLAREIAARPETPQTAEAWRELPGVGPYTAAAITSISFGAPAACVDGNVVRILARLTADGTEFRDSASAARVFAPLAEALLSPDGPGDHNQAMMELGATVCFRQNPQCMICPVREFCLAAQQGDPEAYPRLAPKKIERRTVVRVWCERRGSLLLHRAAAGARRLANQHELPTAEQAGLGVQLLDAGKLLARKKRSITRFQITELIYAASPPRLPAAAAGLVWVPLAELEAITLSGPHRRWIGEIRAARQPGMAHTKPRSSRSV